MNRDEGEGKMAAIMEPAHMRSFIANICAGRRWLPAAGLLLLAGCAQFQPTSDPSLVSNVVAEQTGPRSDELDQIQKRLANLDSQLSEIAFQIRANRQAIEEVKAAVAELRQWREEAASQLARLPALAAETERLGERLKTLDRRTAGLDRRLTRYDAALAKLRNSLSNRQAQPRFGIHVADYPNAVAAAAGWIALKEKLHENVKGLHAIVKRASGGPENPEYVQLVVGPFEEAAEAQARCTAIKSLTTICEVVPFSGDPLSGNTPSR